MATRGRRRPRFEPSMATRGRRRTQRANSAQGAGRLRVATRGSRGRGTTGGWCAVLCCTAVLHCCAALLCFCFGPSSSYNTELLHRWVDTLSSDPTVTTPSCYCGLLHCCAALLRCCAVLHCCVVTVRHPLRVTTPSCHPVVRPHSQHRKVALRGTGVIWTYGSNPASDLPTESNQWRKTGPQAVFRTVMVPDTVCPFSNRLTSL
jgi:hypothetical protein